LVAEYGIYGFCYYHYWFNGKRLLERPFNEVLESKKPNFPFCLCWANESWCRSWDGRSQDILIGQEYSETDDINHIKWLIKAFKDDRYIRYQGKPIFLVYKASQLPNPKKTTAIWREEAFKQGIGELFLCRVESSIKEQASPPEEIGFDAAVEFQPDWPHLGKPWRGNFFYRLFRRVGAINNPFQSHRIYLYQDVIKRMRNKKDVTYLRFPGLTPSWDNSARRRKDAVILHGSTPELYKEWLLSLLNKLSRSPDQDRIVFVNAWNEWAEGNHLEPCLKWGRQYLEATASALASSRLASIRTEASGR